MKSYKLLTTIFILIICNNVFAQNVGIGNPTPTMKLEVKASDSAVLLLRNESTSGLDIKNSMFFKTGNFFSGGIATIGSGASHRMGFFTFAGGSPSSLYERFSITDGGNIGIGAINPINKFQIGNPPAFSGNDIAIGNGTQGMSLFQSVPASIWYSNVNFSLMPAGGGIGNVGIGTTTPNERFVLSQFGIGFSQQDPTGVAKIGFYTSATQTYLQTHTNNDLLFSTNNGVAQMVLTTAGNVGIGTSNPTYKLSVNGNVRTKEVVVETAWADYVFAKDYKLPSLIDVEKYIKENNHLPEIPSAEEIQTNGLKVGEVQTKMMQKIEELTLYIIEMKKEIELLKAKK
jgi:hypothetical protein